MRESNSTNHAPNAQEPRRFLIDTYAQCRATIGHCPNAQTWVTRRKYAEPTYVHSLRCNQWHCPWCGPRRAYALAAKCELADPTKFITLTCRPAYAPSPREAYDQLRPLLPDLHKRIRTAWGPFDYMKVLEQHANGYPHWHYVARCGFIPQRWLSAEWLRMTGNHRVDIRAVKRKIGCFNYVAKYLCKQSYIPWTNRRVSFSRDFFLKQQTPQEPRERNNYEARHKQHPSTYLVDHCHGQIVIEQRPGLWQIDDPCAPANEIEP